jgi:hypothetical protein
VDPNQKQPSAPDDRLARALLWSKDAPLFIDELNVARFYDAVVRPTFTETSREIRVTEDEKKEIRGALKIGAKMQLPSWLSGILAAGADASAEGSGQDTNSKGTSGTVSLEKIDNAPRQLEQITAVYVMRRLDRLLVGSKADAIDWQTRKEADQVPRALIFLDLPIGTKMIPMAAEFENGVVVTLFDKFREKSGALPPPYEFDKKLEYWQWFDKHFDISTAMNLVEAAAKENGKIHWIDFRVPLNSEGLTMHLHIETSGRYYTGIVAHFFMRRALEHGIRLIGTLKDGPDMNVLAIFEK